MRHNTLRGCSYDGCADRSWIAFYFHLCWCWSHAGSGQHSLHLCQAPSANCTWLGSSTAPPQLYYQKGDDDVKGLMRAWQKCGRRFLQPGKMSPKGLCRGVFSGGEFWTAKDELPVFFLLCCNAFVLKPIVSLHCRVVVRKMRGEQECSFNT